MAREAVLLLLCNSIDAFQLYGQSPQCVRRGRCSSKLGLFDAFKSPEEFAVLQAKKDLAAVEDSDAPDTSANRMKLAEARKHLDVAEAGWAEVVEDQEAGEAAKLAVIEAREDIDTRRIEATQRLEDAQPAATRAAAGKLTAEEACEGVAEIARAERELAAAANAKAAAAEAELTSAEKVVAEWAAAVQAAAADEAAAKAAIKAAAADLVVWEQANPGAALASASGAVLADAGTALLSSLFGEPKSVREAKEKAQAEEAAVAAAAQPAEPSEEDATAAQAAAEAKALTEAAAARAAAEAAAAEAKAAAARAAEAEAAVVRATAERAVAEEEAAAREAAAVDAELRRKREEAQATLRTRRPRPLSESILDAAVGAVLNASATKEEGGGGDGLGKVASWVAQERERMLVESEAKERYGRLALFEADLELLGVTVDEAVTMDAKQLTPAPYPPTPTLPLTSTPIPNPNPKPQPEPGGYGREVAAPSLPRPLPRTAPRRARPTLGRGARGSAKRVRAQRRLRSREEAAGEDLKKRHRWRT